MRRSFLLVGCAGFALLGLDGLQQWTYVRYAPQTQAELQLVNNPAGPLIQAVLIAGLGIDDAETATCLRDINTSVQTLSEWNPGRLEISAVTPTGSNFSTKQALDLISTRQCDHLVIYLTGHGGGKNFGAVGGMNLTGEAFADALERATFKTATVVVDCCWSGAFVLPLENRTFSGPVTAVTSTDRHKPSPFPVSFLSPCSYGHTFFENWSGDADRAFETTNAQRQSLRWLYSEKFGLLGEIRHFQTAADATNTFEAISSASAEDSES